MTGVDQLRGEAHQCWRSTRDTAFLTEKRAKMYDGKLGKGEEKGGKGNALQEICHVHIIRISYLCIVASN